MIEFLIFLRTALAGLKEAVEEVFDNMIEDIDNELKNNL